MEEEQMIKCMILGGILVCQIIKTVIVVKAAKAIKNYFTAPEEEENN